MFNGDAFVGAEGHLHILARHDQRKRRYRNKRIVEENIGLARQEGKIRIVFDLRRQIGKL